MFLVVTLVALLSQSVRTDSSDSDSSFDATELIFDTTDSGEDYTTISCGDTLTGTLDDDTTLYFIFNNTEEEDVLFTNCGSDFDTYMLLYNETFYDITDKSANGCWGDDCTYPQYECGWDKETIVMENLTTGVYYLGLDYWMWGANTLNYSVKVECGTFSQYTTTPSPWYYSTTSSSYSTTSVNIDPDSTTWSSIECGEQKEFSLDWDMMMILNFTNPSQQDVLFETCESDTDTHTVLFDSSWTDITDQSVNGCDGDDCHLDDNAYSTTSSGYSTTSSGGWDWTISYQSIECGESVNASLDYGEALVLNFTNPEEQGVLFMTCQSEADTHTVLFNSNWSSINHQSVKGCWGDDCHVLGSRYQCNYFSENFVMDDLAAEDYYLVLNWPGHYAGNYSVEVECGINVSNFTTSTTTWSPYNYNYYYYYDWFNYTWFDSTSISTTSTTSSPSCHYYSENFLMDDLAAGDYYLLFNTIGWYTGNYTIEVTCGNGTDDTVADYYTVGSIECGETVTGTLDAYETVYLNFTLSDDQDVLFSNCESDFDTTMQLISSDGGYITDEATNACDGDDCSHGSYCDLWKREVFFMEDLQAGSYLLEVGSYNMTGGDYEVEVSCETDDDWDDVLDDIDAAIPLTVMASMVATFAGILY